MKHYSKLKQQVVYSFFNTFSAGNSTPVSKKGPKDYRVVSPRFKPPTPAHSFTATPRRTGPPASAALSARKSMPAHLTPSGSGKRVSFGPYISPEYIDKNMPPSTPVKKGAAPPNGTPATSTPSSLLKRPAGPAPATVCLLCFFLF
jgi:hypothetical protein